MKRRHRYVAPYSPPRQARARAIAIERPMEAREWWVTAFRVILALLAPYLIVALSGCTQDFKGEKVDYGPAEKDEKVMGAIINMWRDSHPENTKVGAFVHFATSQAIAGGAYKATVSDTGHTVVKRVESADTITLSVVEIKYSYRENQPAEKLLRQFELAFEKEGARIANFSSDRELAVNMLTTLAKKARVSAKIQTDDEDLPQPTYHHLQTWEDVGPPPAAVQNTTGCLGLPNCTMRYRHVKVDLVYWDKPEGNRLAIELITSPDIPQTIGYNMSRVNTFIPGLMRSCLSQMVEVEAGSTKTLVTECQDVLSFAYEPAP